MDRHKYARAPVDDNFPLSMWSNRWSTMPVHKGLEDYMRFPNPDRRATLDFMPGADVPVIRQPFEAGDVLPFWASGARNVGRHAKLLGDIGKGQACPRAMCCERHIYRAPVKPRPQNGRRSATP